jgi:1,4-dihydroxy-2-naphthoyl-CoA hydrolase
MADDDTRVTIDELNALSTGKFPGYVGFHVREVRRGNVVAELEVQPHHLAPNGFLHAAVVITLADTACGYGVRTALPDGAVGFTTVELKSNFLGTALDGVVQCDARMAHGGRTTQVWDATVTAGERTIALFRCTQLVLYPRD